MRSDVARFSSYSLDARVKCRKWKKVTHPCVVLPRPSMCRSRSTRSNSVLETIEFGKRHWLRKSKAPTLDANFRQGTYLKVLLHVAFLPALPVNEPI